MELENIRQTVSEAIKELLEEYRAQLEKETAEQRVSRPRVAPDSAPQGAEEEEVYAATARLMHAIATRRYDEAERLERQFAEKGWYTRAGASSTDVGALLPTIVVDRIMELIPQYGVASRLCDVQTFDSDNVRVPYTQAELSVYAVNELAEIKSSKLAFQNVTLEFKKFGLIAPWSTEVDEATAVRYTQRLIEAAARAFAKKLDQLILTANAEPDNHGLSGLLYATSVAEYTLAAGKTQFTQASLDDYLKAQTLFPDGVSLQLNGVYSESVDRYLNITTDPGGRYVFQPAGLVTGIRPPSGTSYKQIGSAVFVPSSVMPGVSTPSQAGKPFAVIGDFRYVMVGVRRDVRVDLLSEATVVDPDNPTQKINLATQDARAIRFTARWAVLLPPDVLQPKLFVRMKTANS